MLSRITHRHTHHGDDDGGDDDGDDDDGDGDDGDVKMTRSMSGKKLCGY